jgi:hypothetical protein
MEDELMKRDDKRKITSKSNVAKAREAKLEQLRMLKALREKKMKKKIESESESESDSSSIDSSSSSEEEVKKIKKKAPKNVDQTKKIKQLLKDMEKIKKKQTKKPKKRPTPPTPSPAPALQHAPRMIIEEKTPKPDQSINQVMAKEQLLRKLINF